MRHYRLENHGSIWLMRPLTDAFTKWLRDTAPEDAQFMGDAMAIEPRYVEGVVEAAKDAGFEPGNGGVQRERQLKGARR